MSTDFSAAYAEAVKNAMVMISFHARTWTGQRTDQKATHDLAASKGASSKAGKFTKNLLAGADAQLKACQAVVSQARSRFYRWTLPMAFGISEGDNRGARALPNTALIDFLAELDEDKKDLQRCLDALVTAWPGAVQQAAGALGQLFDANDYPAPEDVRTRFAFRLDFMPMPDRAGYGRLHPDIAQQLGAALDQKLAESANTALREAWDRVQSQVEHLVDRLGKPDAVFHDSLLDNTAVLAKLLKHFNVMGDPAMTEVQQRLEALGRHVPKQIRKDTTLRGSLASEAQDLMTRIREAQGLE